MRTTRDLYGLYLTVNLIVLLCQILLILIIAVTTAVLVQMSVVQMQSVENESQSPCKRLFNR